MPSNPPYNDNWNGSEPEVVAARQEEQCYYELNTLGGKFRCTLRNGHGGLHSSEPVPTAAKEEGEPQESVEEVFCMKRDPDTGFACAMRPGHKGRHDSYYIPPAPVAAGPQPGFNAKRDDGCICVHRQGDYPDCPVHGKDALNPPAPERGEPEGIEDLFIVGGHIKTEQGLIYIAAPNGYTQNEINRRIRAAEKIGEQRGFNACREMAAGLCIKTAVDRRTSPIKMAKSDKVIMEKCAVQCELLHGDIRNLKPEASK